MIVTKINKVDDDETNEVSIFVYLLITKTEVITKTVNFYMFLFENSCSEMPKCS